MDIDKILFTLGFSEETDYKYAELFISDTLELSINREANRIYLSKSRNFYSSEVVKSWKLTTENLFKAVEYGRTII